MNKVSSPSTKYTAVTTQIALDTKKQKQLKTKTKKQLAQTRNKNNATSVILVP
jgi:hypothetical protein